MLFARWSYLSESLLMMKYPSTYLGKLKDTLGGNLKKSFFFCSFF